MSAFHATRLTRFQIALIGILAAASWVAVVALIAAEHGSERRATFDGNARERGR